MEHFELLNLAIESLPLGVTIIDINGKIVYANHAQAEMHGYESHELLGQHTKIFAPPDMWGPLEIKPFQDKSLFIRESLNNNKTGRSFPVRLISIPVKNEKREVLGLVTICEDITKIRELEKQQDRAKELTHRLKNLKLLELAIKGIAHKFNNVLSVCHCNMELAQMKSPENISVYIKKTQEAVRSGKTLVKSLVQYSGTNATGKFDLIDIGDIARQVVDILNIGNGNIKIRLKVTPGLWKVFGNPLLIQRVITVLAINIGELIEPIENEHPMVSIGLDNIVLPRKSIKARAVTDEFVRLTVLASGRAKAGKDVAHLFEQFCNIGNNAEEFVAAISQVNNIVKNHCGWIETSSKSESGFAVVKFFLPRQEAKAESDLESDVLISRGNGTILFVEDERSLAEAVKELLEYLGYTVILVFSGEDALNIFEKRSECIDMLVLDLKLPGISGVEILGRIRERKPGIKVILTSGTTHELESAAISGQFGFISKPYDFADLANAIKASLSEADESGNLPDIKNKINRITSYFTEEKTLPYKGHLTDSLAVYTIFGRLSVEPREKFLAVFLDTQKKIIAYDEIAQGTVDNVFVYPQEIARSALLAGASALILIHNHPSGSLNPSGDDMRLTTHIKSVCDLLGIELVDHVIIGQTGFFSFANKKMI